MIQAAALLPIAPLLLLPFILIFFIVVFPFWLVGVAVLWTLEWCVRLAGGGPDGRWSAKVHGWFRWVLTFGGFAETYAASLSGDQPQAISPQASVPKPGLRYRPRLRRDSQPHIRAE